MRVLMAMVAMAAALLAGRDLGHGDFIGAGLWAMSMTCAAWVLIGLEREQEVESDDDRQ